MPAWRFNQILSEYTAIIIMMKYRIYNCAIAITFTVILSIASFWALYFLQFSNEIRELHNDPNMPEGKEIAKLNRAIALRPDLDRAWRMKAALVSFGHPHQAEALIRNAIHINPRNWRNWNELGLIELQLGDFIRSRQALISATRYDHGFESHYVLGNLALLQNNRKEFLHEMRIALQIAPTGDVYTILNEIQRLRLGKRNWTNLIPQQRTKIAAMAVDYLTTIHRWRAALNIWNAMDCRGYDAKPCRQMAMDLVNSLCNQAIKKEGINQMRLTLAMYKVWNHSIKHNLVHGPLARIGEVSNGNFNHSWIWQIFGWGAVGVSPRIILGAGPQHANAVRIHLNGYEPSHLQLFDQWVWVAPGMRYQIQFSSRRLGYSKQTGVVLAVSMANGKVLCTIPAVLHQQWRQNRCAFTVSKNQSLVLLSFNYVRPLGQVPMRGSFDLAHVSLRRISIN